MIQSLPLATVEHDDVDRLGYLFHGLDHDAVKRGFFRHLLQVVEHQRRRGPESREQFAEEALRKRWQVLQVQIARDQRLLPRRDLNPRLFAAEVLRWHRPGTDKPAMTTSAAPIPAGFEPIFGDSSSFIGLCGPLYMRRAADALPVVALRIDDKHLNLLGIAHGGLLVTLADSALGFVLNHARNVPLSLVTVSLSTDFAAPAMRGDWVEAHVDILRIGSRMAFANCCLHVGERRILRASGVFAVIKPVGGQTGFDG